MTAKNGEKRIRPVMPPRMSKARFAAVCQTGTGRVASGVEVICASFTSSVFSNIAGTEPIWKNSFEQQRANEPWQSFEITCQFTARLLDDAKNPFHAQGS